MREASNKLITAILPIGQVGKVVEQLAQQGIHSYEVTHARGSGLHTMDDRPQFSEEKERDVLAVVVELSRAELIFDKVFEAAEMNRPGGGIMYMAPLDMAALYQIPAEPSGTEKEAL